MDGQPSVLYTAFDRVPSPKGASTHITYFVRGLVDAGYRVQLITAGDPDLPEQGEYCGASIQRVAGGPEASFLQRAVEFGAAVMRHVESAPPCQVAHFRSAWSGLSLVQAQPRFGYRTLFEVNGLPSVELKYHYPALAGSPLLAKIREQEVLTMLLADAIICPSNVTRDFISSLGIPRHKITVIPNGVDTRHFTPEPAAAGPGPATLLYVGTLADWQGLDLLLEALPAIRTAHDVTLHIVGSGRGRQRKDLLKRIHKLGLDEAVSIDPPVPHHQVPALINQAAVCVAPLTYNDRNVTQGCCPIKVIEYMACGRPLAAANLPVVRELAREGIDALLFDPGDPADLARSVVRLLDDPALAASVGSRAARRARERFSWQRAQQRLLQVYEALLAAPAQAAG